MLFIDTLHLPYPEESKGENRMEPDFSNRKTVGFTVAQG